MFMKNVQELNAQERKNVLLLEQLFVKEWEDLVLTKKLHQLANNYNVVTNSENAQTTNVDLFNVNVNLLELQNVQQDIDVVL